MKTIVLIAIVGFAAQLVDGSLGMAYGVTTTTLLLAIGTNPAAASATVHLAEIGTTLVSGVSHWRFGNVDWKVVRRIAVPGAIGAFLGATILSTLSTEAAAPIMAIILLLLGLYILLRFTFQGIPRHNLGKPLRKRFLGPLGFVAGFVDATGGGGWGPVGTPAILASGRLEPRKVIGSIDTSEFIIAVAASLGFLFSLGSQGINFAWVGAILVGGVIAAPIAAWLVRHIPPRLLGSSVGGLIIFTNTRSLFRSDLVDVPQTAQTVIYGIIIVAWAAAFAYSLQQYLGDRENESSDAVSRVREEQEHESIAARSDEGDAVAAS
ncbi:sulfite exporter TauE/SafE family protein [Gordonia sp. OPL2]|uniref:sulfite exporter TauE/SafE family protein n=1 Tax=Gordonia sp. OPL2 TaxID=2486274 RepID=UPI0016558029|nr:sulfite exporter TauE/SafE family protein [Gordonia sp. OPL2]RPA19594.1 sulfite exporter TauE/SafE family protein [Gordonia sp. OPL2]